MCGIVGIIRTDSSPVDERVLEAMTHTIQHRGPSGSGTFIHHQVGLGNARLAIIDLEGGRQPLCNEDGQVWITYNGELYNFRELRGELEAQGHVFHTQSDTETIVHAYEAWGKRCVERFRGMFAFAIADLHRGEVFLARDHLGIKPLYYLLAPGLFAFASELQALHCIPNLVLQLDLRALDQYLFLQYIPAPRTIFRQVNKLLPAHRMSITIDGRTSGPEEYWQLNFAPDNRRSEAEWLDVLDATLRDSVQAHLVADVPFGAFLSGGVDSSSVVAYMAQILGQPVRTFTIGFKEDDFSEVNYAGVVAQRWRTDHHVEIVRPDALAILPELVRHYGEPYGDSSAIPTYYVAQMAQRHVPMVLSGDGGDEFFAGYITYIYWMKWITGEGFPLWKRLARPLASRLLPGRYPRRQRDLQSWYRMICYLNEDQRLLLWRPEYRKICAQPVEELEAFFGQTTEYELCQAVQYMDIKSYLPYDILTKVDIATMMHGLEARTPLVDVRMAEFAATIPQSFNISLNQQNRWEGKRLLKKLLSRYYPDEFLQRPKMGFAIPIQHWFSKNGALHDEINQRLLSPNSLLKEFFEPVQIKTLVGQNLYGPVWLLLFLDEWLRQNISRIGW